MEKNPLVFVSISNSRSGQSDRTVNLIKALRKHGLQVLVGGGSQNIGWLTHKISDLQTISFSESYGFDYYIETLSGLKQWSLRSRLMKSCWLEGRQIKRIQRKYQIQAIISENHLGLKSSKIPSVLFLTHPWITPSCFTGLAGWMLNRFLKRTLQGFRMVWYADLTDESLTGVSDIHKLHPDIRNIGNLHKWDTGNDNISSFDYDLCIILSGPEPQRSRLEAKIINQLTHLEGRFMIMRGIFGSDCRVHSSHNLCMVDQLEPQALRSLVQRSAALLCRPDYATLIALSGSGKPLILVPQKGQPCQEHLAKQLSQAGYGLPVDEEGLSLKHNLEEVRHKQAFPDFWSPTLLDSAIIDLVGLIKNDQICGSKDENKY